MQRRDPTADFCLRLPAGLYTLSPGCGLLLRTSRRGSRSCASRPSPTHSSMLLESWSVYLSNPCLMRPCPMCSRSSSITFAPLPGKGGLTVATCVAQSHSQVFHLLSPFGLAPQVFATLFLLRVPKKEHLLKGNTSWYSRLCMRLSCEQKSVRGQAHHGDDAKFAKSV